MHILSHCHHDNGNCPNVLHTYSDDVSLSPASRGQCCGLGPVLCWAGPGTPEADGWRMERPGPLPHRSGHSSLRRASGGPRVVTVSRMWGPEVVNTQSHSHGPIKSDALNLALDVRNNICGGLFHF